MSWPLRLFVLIGLFALSGCMVLDEIDSAQAKMNGAVEPETTETATSVEAPTTRGELLERSKEWWNQATSLAPAGKDAGIVNCRLREGTQFMSKDDCLLRGGVPRGVSG